MNGSRAVPCYPEASAARRQEHAGLADFLSKPKPVEMEWWLSSAPDAEVLASHLVEDEGVYLWLQLPDVAEPRAYVLPWDRAGAEQLQEATRETEEQGGGVKMRLPYEPSLDPDEPKFYARPQPVLPPKDLVQPPPELYQQPGQDLDLAAVGPSCWLSI